MKCFLVAAAVAALATVFGLPSEKWWETRPYAQWTPGEVKSLLTNSPWSKAHTVTINNGLDARTRGFVATGGGDLQREQHNFFHVRFLTAKPVRMAIARERMLQHPELMDAARLAGLQRFVQQPDDTHIIVSLVLSSRPPGAPTLFEFRTELLRARLTAVAATTFLATGSGQRVYVTEYRPPDQRDLGSLYYFPRLREDGSPLVTVEDKEIRFETAIGGQRIWRQFKLTDMVFAGRLEI